MTNNVNPFDGRVLFDDVMNADTWGTIMSEDTASDQTSQGSEEFVAGCNHADCAAAAQVASNAVEVAGQYIGTIDGKTLVGVSREDIAHQALEHFISTGEYQTTESEWVNTDDSY